MRNEINLQSKQMENEHLREKNKEDETEIEQTQEEYKEEATSLFESLVDRKEELKVRSIAELGVASPDEVRKLAKKNREKRIARQRERAAENTMLEQQYLNEKNRKQKGVNQQHMHSIDKSKPRKLRGARIRRLDDLSPIKKVDNHDDHQHCHNKKEQKDDTQLNAEHVFKPKGKERIKPSGKLKPEKRALMLNAANYRQDPEDFTSDMKQKKISSVIRGNFNEYNQLNRIKQRADLVEKYQKIQDQIENFYVAPTSFECQEIIIALQQNEVDAREFLQKDPELLAQYDENLQTFKIMWEQVQLCQSIFVTALIRLNQGRPVKLENCDFMRQLDALWDDPEVMRTYLKSTFNLDSLIESLSQWMGSVVRTCEKKRFALFSCGSDDRVIRYKLRDEACPLTAEKLIEFIHSVQQDGLNCKLGLA